MIPDVLITAVLSIRRNTKKKLFVGANCVGVFHILFFFKLGSLKDAMYCIFLFNRNFICGILHILLSYHVSGMSATKTKMNLGISSPETDYSLHSLWLEMKSLGKYLT